MSDYISREKAIKSICQYGTAQEKIGRYAVTISELKQTVADTLSDLPNADVRENVTGEWIYDKAIENWRCSKCNETPKTLGYVGTDDFMREHFKFCNHCGADMRGKA